MGAGYYISKTRLIIIVCLWIAITVLVGLLAGLIKKSCPPEDGTQTTTPSDSMTSLRPSQEATTLPPQGDGPWMDPFLPSFTYPIHYELWFYPDFYFNGTTFEGRENITIQVTENTKYILVHYKMMDITQTRAYLENGAELEVVQAFGYEVNQFWVTELRNEISAGTTIVLHLQFQGSLVNGIVGYYKSTYVNMDTGVESWLATTKFQPTDARKAFPNFDEPKYKANFTITLHHWSNFTALSNMPNNSYTVIDDVWRETGFETTPLMSSYLVCFIVCDFVYKENTLANGKPHRIWTSSDKINNVDYALKIGKQVEDYFETEFDMEFHLPKLDQVAIPDYPSGATEHWGIITYRESRLLFDENEAGAADKQGVAEIVAHELAHNFFGNIITCEWWNDIWLNEGFASYYGDMSLVDIEPDWEMEDHFVVTTTQSIMQSDANLGSRAITKNVTHPDEINQAFSGVVYRKGAAVLRMLQYFMGKDEFRSAIQKYLKKHEYGTVVTDDLWEALQEQVGDSYNIAAMFDPWLEQMGFPVVNITEVDGNQLHAEQQRFLNDPTANADIPISEFGYKWYVPLTYQIGSSSDINNLWLNMSSGTIVDPRENDDEWIKFNYKQSGYYRVNYPLNMWNQLATQLQRDHEVFEPIDRAHILDDAFNLGRATQLDYPVALNLIMYLANETHYFPWTSTGSGLSYISYMLYNDGDYTLWRKYMQQISDPIMEKLKVEDTGTHLEILNRRNNIIPIACGHGHIQCLKNNTELFLRWIEDDSFDLSPNLRRSVYKFGMQQTGGEDVWNKVWNRYLSASGQEKDNLVYCLSWTSRLWLIQRYLDFAMDPNIIRTQDFFTVIGYISMNINANRYLFDWSQANYQTLLDRFGTSDRYFGRMVPLMVAGYNTNFQLEEVMNFYEKWPDAGAGMGPRFASIVSIRSNIAWMDKNKDGIIEWLKENVTP